MSDASTSPQDTTALEGDPTLTAYVVGDTEGWVIEPASPRRRWMDEFSSGFPYRCLPLSIANQCGWVVRCPVGLAATWYGGLAPTTMRLSFDERPDRFSREISSHFGGGVLTFSLPWLFRTPAGVGLYVRGLPNSFREGAQALDAIVETSWAPMTFTMNWKLLDANRTVRFEKGDAIALLMPVRLDLVESMRPKVLPVDADPVLAAEYRKWSAYRTGFIHKSDRAPEEWQKDYMVGRRLDGTTEESHKSRLKVRAFEGA